MGDVPGIVAQAERAARLAGFPLEADGVNPSCCSPEVGRKRTAFFSTPGLTSVELVMPAGDESALVGTRTV